MGGWISQYHPMTTQSTTAPVWVSDGTWITGTPFFSLHDDADRGGVMFNTNGFALAVGDVAVVTMDFKGKGITAPDKLDHYWLSFGFRTGGVNPWEFGDLAASAVFLTGQGSSQSRGFSLWNTASDSWSPPYPHCAIPSHENYESDIITITFWVERTIDGFGPSTLITSNHTTGVQSLAVSRVNQLNQNNSAAERLYFFFDLPSHLDGSGGLSAVGSRVKVRNIKLRIDKAAPPPPVLTPSGPVIFESDGSLLDGWKLQFHETTSAKLQEAVWKSDGSRIIGSVIHSDYLDADLGGAMFHMNGFTVEVGEVATFTMDFEGRGITAPDNRNHWWFTFGFRSGGVHPWDTGDIAAYATFRTGIGADQFDGFTVWNAWSDSWTAPYPHCAIRSDENYDSDVITITFSVERMADGFGPSTLVTSNHTTGGRSVAVGGMNQLNQNNSATGTLYFYVEIPSELDGPGGHSAAGSLVKIRNMKLTVDKPSEEQAALIHEIPAQSGSNPVATPVITSILGIKRLSNEEAGNEYSAEISGQVLNLHLAQQRIFIHDGVSGLYVAIPNPMFNAEKLKVGSDVRIRGTTLDGGYSPVLVATSIETTGWRPLPHARRLDQTLHSSTGIDVEWVEVEGRPIAMDYVVGSDDHFRILLEVFDTADVFDTVMEVFVPREGDDLRRMKPYMFQRVRLKGVLGTTSSRQLQMTGRVLYINSLDDFKLSPEFAGVVPRSFAIHELMQYNKESEGLVKTEGTVTSATADTIYLRGEKGSLKASMFQEMRLYPGDQVELVGYVNVQPVSPAFLTVSSTRLSTDRIPEPVKVVLDREDVNSDWNYELVTLEAEFVHVEKTFTERSVAFDEKARTFIVQEVLWCRAGPRIFEAKLPSGIPAPDGLRPGSKLQLTGIFHIEKTLNPQLQVATDSLWLELADDSSIVILQQASWWTPRRLLWGLIITLFSSLAFLLWVVALQKTVASQTETIGTQIVRETTLNERQRIARELHDTLEQGLTALSFQIKRIYKKISSDPESGRKAVQMAEKMLHACREESRASIQDLRGGILEEMDLPSAIRKTIERQSDETTAGQGIINYDLKVKGHPVRLTLFAEQQVLRLVLEAIHNAVKHASPDHIRVRLHYEEHKLEVLVEDDGCGFDPDLLRSSDRFGVLGMYERANRLKGNLNVDSHPGEGTRIMLSCPLEDFLEETKL